MWAVFGAVICNTDRHFGNFGVLVDNKTNHIKDFAPIIKKLASLDVRFYVLYNEDERR